MNKHDDGPLILHMPFVLVTAPLATAMALGLALSFTTVGATSIGMMNYGALLSRDVAAAWMNLPWLLCAPLLALAYGCAIAYALRAPFRHRDAILACVCLPWLVSPVANGVLWHFLLSAQTGPVNWLLSLPSPLADRTGARLALVAIDIWRSAPLAALIFTPWVRSLPAELWEQALLDGAGRWRRMVDIAIPFLRSPLLLLAALLVGQSLTGFEWIHLLTGGGPGTATTTPALLAYQRGFLTGDWYAGSALAWSFMLPLLGLIGWAAVRIPQMPGQTTSPIEIASRPTIGRARVMLLTLVAVVMNTPLLVAAGAAFGFTPGEIAPTLAHFADLGQTASGFVASIGWTLVCALLGVGVGVICAMPVAYTLARRSATRQRRMGAAIVSILALLSLFPIGFALPLRELWRRSSLIDTPFGLALAFAALCAPLCAYLLMGSLGGLSREITYAAELEGATRVQVLIFVAAPAVSLDLMVVGGLAFALCWNQFLIPLAVAGGATKTVTIALTDFFLFERDLDWSTAAAALLVSLLPLSALFMWLMRSLRIRSDVA